MAFWYWLVLAAAFAVIEIAVPAMVCIWLAAAALGTAFIAWLTPDAAWEYPIVDGRGRVRVDDTVWLVEGPDLPAGARVQVTGVANTLLRVTPF